MRVHDVLMGFGLVAGLAAGLTHRADAQPDGQLFLSLSPTQRYGERPVPFFTTFDFHLFTGSLSTPAFEAWEATVTVPAELTVLSRTLHPTSSVDLGSGPDNWVVGAGTCVLAGSPFELVTYSAFLGGVHQNLTVALGPSIPSSFGGLAPGWVECGGSPLHAFDDWQDNTITINPTTDNEIHLSLAPDMLETSGGVALSTPFSFHVLADLTAPTTLDAWEAQIDLPPELLVTSRYLSPPGATNLGAGDNFIVVLPACQETGGALSLLATYDVVPNAVGSFTIGLSPASPSSYPDDPQPAWKDCEAVRLFRDTWAGNGINVEVLDIDLVARSWTVPTRWDGCWLDLGLEIENTGSSPSGPFTVAVALMQAPPTSHDLGPDDVLLWTGEVSGIAPLDTFVDAPSLRWPSGFSSTNGQAHAALFIDYLDAALESDESNNWVSSPILVGPPQILDISDVPGDQGGQVGLSFRRSAQDEPGAATPIDIYRVYRRPDPPAGPSKLSASMSWDLMGQLPADGSPEYNLSVPTLADSTVTGGLPWSVYFVRALADGELITFDSCPDSGYSLDNLAPDPPQGFQWTQWIEGIGPELSWQPSGESDFDAFRLYRGPTPDFAPDENNRIAQLASTQYIDVSWSQAQSFPILYKLSAVDLAGNESGYSDVTVQPPAVAVTGNHATLALGPGVPNPAREEALLQFDLPAPSRVSLAIYDTRGRRVRSAFWGRLLPAGRHEWVWNRRDDRNAPVAAGSYMIRLETAWRTLSSKVTVVD